MFLTYIHTSRRKEIIERKPEIKIKKYTERSANQNVNPLKIK